jgi:hypothetical protein
MGIISKLEKNRQQDGVVSVNTTSKVPLEDPEVVLTDQEIDFILLKLRESTYKGYEFEKYVTIYNKLSSHILKK